MKIKDVIVTESPAGTSYQHSKYSPTPAELVAQVEKNRAAEKAAQSFPLSPDAQAALSNIPSGQSAQPKKAASKKGTAKSDPAVMARQKELIAAGAKIKADGIMGPATREAEKQFGAQIDTAKAQAQQGQPGPTTVTNPAQADQNAQTDAVPADSSSMAPAPAQSGPEAPSAELDRLKQLAIGQNTLNQQASQQGAAMAQAAKEPTPAPNTNPLGVTAQAGPAFGQAAPTPDKPNTQTGQSAQPAQPAKDPTVAPAVTSSSGQPVKTGTGGTLTSRSQDEIAWANANPANRFNPNGYPGAGNWDPKTGRTVQKDAQGNVVKDKSLGDKVSDFFGGLGKQSSGQAAQPAAGDQSGGSTTGNKAFLPGAAGGAKEDIEMLRKLSGLR